MKIAMIGSGAAGSVFAAYLRKGGAELWLVDKYKAHMDKIAADGLVFRTPEGEEVLTGFHTSATAHDIGTMDMVILMVKATQTADVMADTMPCIGPETVVVSLQNGLGNDEVLAQFVETDRILYGSGLIGTELAGPGVCVSKPEKGTTTRRPTPPARRSRRASRRAAATRALTRMCARTSGRKSSPTAAITA